MHIPVPVDAHAQISCPINARGMVLAWIGVGEIKLDCAILLTININREHTMYMHVATMYVQCKCMYVHGYKVYMYSGWTIHA